METRYPTNHLVMLKKLEISILTVELEQGKTNEYMEELEGEEEMCCRWRPGGIEEETEL